MDILWRACAFAFIHEVSRPEIRKVVNDHDLFVVAVDRWMDQHNPSSNEIKELASAMNDRIEEWFASANESSELSSPGN